MGGRDSCDLRTLGGLAAIAEVRLAPQGGGSRPHCKGFGFCNFVSEVPVSLVEVADWFCEWRRTVPFAYEQNGISKSTNLELQAARNKDKTRRDRVLFSAEDAEKISERLVSL